MRFANNARFPDLSELESPASLPAEDGSRERVTLPADVQLWIEVERFVERTHISGGVDPDGDSQPPRLLVIRP